MSKEYQLLSEAIQKIGRDEWEDKPLHVIERSIKDFDDKLGILKDRIDSQPKVYASSLSTWLRALNQMKQTYDFPRHPKTYRCIEKAEGKLERRERERSPVKYPQSEHQDEDMETDSYETQPSRRTHGHSGPETRSTTGAHGYDHHSTGVHGHTTQLTHGGRNFSNSDVPIEEKTLYQKSVQMANYAKDKVTGVFSGQGTGNPANSGYYEDEHMRYADAGNPYIRGQQQTTLQMHRSLQASKQMAYDVYANVVTAIEELEAREINGKTTEAKDISGKSKKKKVPRSGAHLPDQGFKDFRAVKEGVKAQLIIFQTHLKNCPPGVVAEIRDELKERTMGWMAVRQEHNLPESEADKMAGKLFEILATGQTPHSYSKSQLERGTMSGRELNENFGKIMVGNHKRAELDRNFREDPDRKAEIPNIRSGNYPHYGAERMSNTYPNVASHLGPYHASDLR
ncbi:unnamed protein product [Owenia fusiformis]|uniref:Uncharacterized protein n=1 Tax=Owenia fusiformis TaxID=6347 RepID=A0A8J1TY07_OWEFU|nr:unnamed protein product [Owenia fusiformis]